jgi:hypothetical protein
MFSFERFLFFLLQLMSSKQAVSLMTKDKEFYAKQVCQLDTKLRYADDRIVQLNEQLEKTKQAREELFTEYVASRLLLVYAYLFECIVWGGALFNAVNCPAFVNFCELHNDDT